MGGTLLDFHPRKLDREIFEDGPSAKIEPLENFRLYGSLVRVVDDPYLCPVRACAVDRPPKQSSESVGANMTQSILVQGEFIRSFLTASLYCGMATREVHSAVSRVHKSSPGRGEYLTQHIYDCRPSLARVCLIPFSVKLSMQECEVAFATVRQYLT